MAMRCNTCKLDKPEAEMCVREGKMIRTCRSCRGTQMRAAALTRAKTMQAAKISRPAAKDQASPPATDSAAAYPVLDILPGWGINAAIDEGRLVLKQLDAGGNTDEISLSQSEARAVFAHFRTWAA